MFIGLMIIILGSIILYFVEELIDKFKRRYRYKHRFDSKPMAKCYCIDCKHHGVTAEKECTMLKRWTYDDFFCQEATPKEE